jgi:hypothetical protein
VQSDRRAYRLNVDPRPLRPEAETEKDGFARLPPAILRARERALRDTHVQLRDPLALGQNERCPGMFVMPAKDGDDPHAGCPLKDIYVVAVGLPRAGTTRLPAGQVYKLGAGAAEGYWAVRVIGSIVGTGGSVAAAYDYVMKEDAGWNLIEAVPLFGRE